MRCVLVVVVLVGCSRSHENEPSCEAMGGFCQTPDLPCAEGSRYAGLDLCEQEYDACCVPEPIVDSGPTTEPDLCRELCHPDRCGFPFESPVQVDECVEHCTTVLPACDDEARSALEACLGYCDYFVPCVYDVTCIQP